MKKSAASVLTAALILLSAALPTARGASSAKSRAAARARTLFPGAHAFGVGARTYCEHSLYPERPHEGGDWSYGGVYEYTESGAIWQMALNYAADPELLEPQINLLYEDRGIRMGLGGVASYQLDDDEADGFEDGTYWQMTTGFSFNLTHSLLLNINAHYVFSTWDKLGEFDFKDLDFGGWLRLVR